MKINGVYIIERKSFSDERGLFEILYEHDYLTTFNIENVSFDQDNVVISNKGA